MYSNNEKGEHTPKVYVSESTPFLRNFPSEADKNYDWHNKMSEMAIENGYKIEQKYFVASPNT